MSSLIEGLLQARTSRIPLDVASVPLPTTIEDGYRLQAEHTEALIRLLGGRQIGFKIGATSAASMQTMGFAAPYHGPILSAWTHASPARLPHDAFFVCVIEAEIGFRLARDVTSPDASEDEVRDAIGGVFPVLEVADSRIQGWPAGGPFVQLADLGSAGAMVVGKPLRDVRLLDVAALPVTLAINGKVFAEGSSAAVLDGPLGRLHSLCCERAAQGAPLKAGDIVSSGNCTTPYFAKAGDRIEARFGTLGTVSLVFD